MGGGGFRASGLPDVCFVSCNGSNSLPLPTSPARTTVVAWTESQSIAQEEEPDSPGSAEQHQWGVRSRSSEPNPGLPMAKATNHFFSSRLSACCCIFVRWLHEGGGQKHRRPELRSSGHFLLHYKGGTVNQHARACGRGRGS